MFASIIERKKKKERKREGGKNSVTFIEYILSSCRGGGEGKERLFFLMGGYDHISLLLL